MNDFLENPKVSFLAFLMVPVFFIVITFGLLEKYDKWRTD